MALKVEEPTLNPVSSRCSLCHESYAPYPTRAWLHLGKWRIGEICPDCLETGPRGAALKMRAWAEELRTSAEETDLLAHEIEAIPEEQWPSRESLQEPPDELDELFLMGWRRVLTAQKVGQEILTD
ncbi:MAG: hypothetical protein HYY20_09220 [Candidatus Tectomicrobia bacterium]|uniref:Uncharacterized protein n=1 Tax=Tectimicrobiota bacterium TaxID=2528274 RepID=A0A932FX05_UNCTE|nr:hypothetical protein [Candidatus Tectomicrobia bacterium]